MGNNVPTDIRLRLMTDFFTSRLSLLFGAIANMAVNIAAVLTHPTASFIVLVALELILLFVRIGLLMAAHRSAARKRAIPTDTFILTSLMWSCLVGVGTAMCFATGDPVLQFLAPITMMGIVGGIATRNNGAPRLAIAQAIICDAPLQFMIPFSGHAFMMISVIQFPMFTIGMINMIYRLNRSYIVVMVAEKESEWRATHDALTGLMNRAGMIAAIDHEGRNATESKDDFALFYVDLDGFKKVNDNFGHAAGDELLRQVAKRIVASVPATCEVGRFGGDEFVFLAPACGVLDAVAMGEKVIAMLSQSFDIGMPVPVRIGASVGIACTPTGIPTDILLAEADSALYKAKNGGKGRCVVTAHKDTQTVRERLVA